MHSEESGPGPRRVKRLVSFFVVAVVLIGAYPAFRWSLRQYTSGIIDGVVGQPLPAFALNDLDGSAWSTERLGGKTVVLNFFRSMCTGCRAEQGDVRQLARELDPDRVVLLGIMVDRVQGFSQSATDATLAEFRYEHPVLMADDAFVAAFHGRGWAQITPITYVAGPDGVVTHAFRHPYELEDLRAVLP